MIEAIAPAAHYAAMANAQEKLIPQPMLNEMRPERIGYRLGLLRRALDLGKSEIADSLGVERTYWSRFEGGKRPITDSFAALLVDRYGVTLDFLILNRWGGLPVHLADKMRAIQSAEE